MENAKKIHVDLKENSYDIFIGNGLLSCCGVIAQKAVKPCKAFIITDSNVAKLYLDTVKKSLSDAGFEVITHIFPAGEKNKRIDTVVTMVSAMADAKMSRTDCVFALGGGVCGDMAGFASSMYMRGIDFIQLSTSLLSDIDSSVGGKTGCDLENGKNLVGAFHQPKAVVIDIDALKTLPEHFICDGTGEAIKAGVIKSEDLFNRIYENNSLSMDDIAECVDIKRLVVQNDEFEHGERKLLNFGHTIGHAIEKYYNFEKYSHGEAITIGMIIMSRAAERHSLCEAGTTEKIIKIAEKIGLKTECNADLQTLCNIVSSDKKRRGDEIDIILPKKIGEAFIHTIKADKLAEFLS